MDADDDAFGDPNGCQMGLLIPRTSSIRDFSRRQPVAVIEELRDVAAIRGLEQTPEWIVDQRRRRPAAGHH